MKILDCTLRDGGYYTNWDFSDELLEQYFNAVNHTPIDYIEIGYRAIPEKSYKGRFYYCPDYLIKKIREKVKKKMVVIIDEKNCTPHQINELLGTLTGLIDMVRITVAPEKINEALALATEIRSLGFEVGFNLMYVSKIKNDSNTLNQLKNLPSDIVTVLYLVDSYGGILPEELEQIIKVVKSGTNIPIGFHGHNNMELALANALIAMKNGVEYIDATITGMGRGAGNLKTELFLTYLSSLGTEVNFNPLSRAVMAFEDLRKKYEWGTNLPYMVSGAFSLPQKDVMDWTTKRFYSYNGILQALINKKTGVEDNVKLLSFKKEQENSTCIVIGGGTSVKDHLEAIRRYIDNSLLPITIIFASSKNARELLGINVPKVFCIQGKESDRLEAVLNGFSLEGIRLVFGPFPRKMGTQIPISMEKFSFELDNWELTGDIEDSHLKLALETGLLYNSKEIMVAGFDGYNTEPSSVEFEVAKENDLVFSRFKNKNVKITSITPSRYKNLDVVSVYALIK